MGTLGTFLLILVSLTSNIEATTVNNRASDLFGSFSDPGNVPPDMYIDDGITGGSDNFDANGTDIDIRGHGIEIFSVSDPYLRCFDVGFCECSSAAISTTVPAGIPTATTDGMALEPDKCLLAPFVHDDSLTKYHMAWTIVNDINPQDLYKVQRMTGDVNRAKNQYRTTWIADYGLIVTWKVDSGGQVNIFQLVIAVGNNGGARETYVMFLYEDLPFAGNGVVGHINGEYSAGNEMFARVCSDVGDQSVADRDMMVEQSNRKCGSNGIYIFETSGDPCKDPTIACSNTLVAGQILNSNCNQSYTPETTCTESYYCIRDELQPDNAILKLYMKWYANTRFQLLNFDTFLGTGGTLESPLGEQEIETFLSAAGTTDVCGKDLADPNTPESIDEYEISIPVNVDHSNVCGIKVDAGEGSMSFVYKIYNGTENKKEVDQHGDVIVAGKCFFEDLPLNVEQTNIFNDFSAPTRMPARVRELVLLVIDRPDADGYYTLSTLKIGRGFYLLVKFDPGLPFNLLTDPLCVYVVDCWASNNAAFVHNDATWERSELFIIDGCPVGADLLGAISTQRSFEADPDHPPDGSLFYLYTGVIRAARWTPVNSGVFQNKIHFQCSVRFSYGDADKEFCEDNCLFDKRKRRSAGDNSKQETLYTTVVIEDEDTEGPKAEQQCGTSMTTTITTIAIFLALILLVTTLCILMTYKLFRLLKTVKRRSEDFKNVSK